LSIEAALDILIEGAGAARNQQCPQQSVDQLRERKISGMRCPAQVEAGECCDQDQEIDFRLG